ncbi:integrin alpha-PS1 isoform X2 [Thrips palmi]|uniref:Integrin alpha-PS1 isoform X2 n=1 Tax=Thrips palmi TaxID=161013 RepID=A0A6P9AGW7_THRPL|nr:integrin alpha-PS1 isoform X2 [Thrips palmi]
MWSARRCAAALACCVLLLHGCGGFNLETRLPIIKTGNKGAYFGYSVAQHQSLNPNHGVENNWMLVGAPVDNNLQPGTNRSGALHRCPVSTYQDDCEQVITDGRRTIDDAGQLMAPLKEEVKNGQWLGVTVRSQGAGGTVLVCAHRYAKTGLDFVWGFGLCYTFNQTLHYDNTWEFCKGRPTDRGHEQYGFCQAGTSGIILDDDSLVVGSPGAYTWRGTTFATSISSDFLARDKTVYFSPVLDHEATVEKYSYLGMSVTGGHFFGKHMSYVTGAPRSNGTGQVVIFRKNGKSSTMKTEATLQGEQFASSFGYEVIAADLNGDKLPDLIVGAPFYFDKEAGGAVYIFMNSIEKCRLSCTKPIKLTGKPESRFGFAIANVSDLNNDGFDDLAIGAPYEGRGAIYIYLGSKNGLILEPAQIIRAENLSADISTLGYSLSGGLDLDENGYPDLLAGAYESDSVVLLRSRPIVGIRTNVHPERNLVNIDPNGQGCERDREYKHTCFSFQTCCTIEAVKHGQRHGESGKSVRVKYRIDAETFAGNNRKFSRVWFGPDNTTRPSYVERVIQPEMSSTGSLNHCEEHIVYVKENTPDIQSAIKFKLSYSLIQDKPRVPRPGEPVPSLSDYPILNQQEAAKTFTATFQKDCGNNDICESDLHVDAEFQLPKSPEPDTWMLMLGKDQELGLNISVSNHRESAYETQLFVSHPASIGYIGRKVEGNKQLSCNPFNNTLVVCAIGNPFNKGSLANLLLRFNPKHLDDTQTMLEFIVFANSTSQEVEKKDPLHLMAAVVKRAELQITGSARPEQVFYAGEVKGESAIKYYDEVGSRILHTYQVFNKGPWRVATVDIHFEWPYQVANNKRDGKWLLYLAGVPEVESQGGGSCTIKKDLVNPLGFENRPGLDETPLDEVAPQGGNSYSSETNRSDDFPHRRRRREQEMIVRPEAYTDKEGRKHQVVYMNCLLGTAKCFKFVCSVHNLLASQAATVRIRARLWNATLVEDYPKVSFVEISSRAKIHIPPSHAIQQDTSDDETMVSTVAYPELLDQQEAEQVPIWIIVVAVVAGLVLLILLTYVLWKFGFFKRQRPDPTLSGNIEKPRSDNSDLDY